MSNAYGIRPMVSVLAALLFRFLHGGLLTAGVLAAIAVAALISSGTLHDGRVVRQLQEWVSAAGPISEPAPAGGEDPRDQATLSAPLHAVVAYIAKRYRVSAAAIEPLVRTAGEAAHADGIDPLLVIAVIGVESGFNPISESVVGAQGLMQVIGKYHRDKLDPHSDRLAVLDPATNIQVGVRVLKESIRRAGSLEAGLQQYAGDPDDEDLIYANKVLTEKQRLDQVVRHRRIDGV